jgi:hypothetical protein
MLVKRGPASADPNMTLARAARYPLIGQPISFFIPFWTRMALHPLKCGPRFALSQSRSRRFDEVAVLGVVEAFILPVEVLCETLYDIF